ncbi:Uma2 family endonuclease [Thermosynechococcaceae cyanobacterium BACA0444]|uniref:Uma2 family endonuclease n=1 Tax=Pseudocalidococcus azoricus BACA0444 TaxID=2918990 RepID=A0AAE4FQJ4_9CYAN|nr:Uma2 family endonuclease [Pseudocalidococcus azoricus]MDS3860388.1 Uma2 family endonuclease [Pseudocalidococcus azoricus BACA0444]
MLTTQSIVTFAEYLDNAAKSNTCYELVQGNLVPMTPATFLHTWIAKFLERLFDQQIMTHSYSWVTYRETVGLRIGTNTVRLPDVVVAPLSAVENLKMNSSVIQSAVPLVVETISPSLIHENYQAKLQDYQSINVQEYWIVNPLELNKVSIYKGQDNNYQLTIFEQNQPIQSQVFPELKVTPNQIFAASAQGC